VPGWTDALFGGWTVSTIVQARSGQHLTPFFSNYYTTSPWNTGKPLDHALFSYLSSRERLMRVR